MNDMVNRVIGVVGEIFLWCVRTSGCALGGGRRKGKGKKGSVRREKEEGISVGEGKRRREMVWEEGELGERVSEGGEQESGYSSDVCAVYYG